MYPLAKETSRIIDLLAGELDLDFLVHVDLLVLDKTRHKDVRALEFHPICPVLPTYSLFLEFPSKPVLLLLEAQFLHLIGSQCQNLFIYNFDWNSCPLKFGHRVVQWHLK